MALPQNIRSQISGLQRNFPVFLPAQIDNENWYPHNETALSTVAVTTIQIPRGVNSVLVQATGQNIRYTLTPAAAPSQTSGFQLITGNKPLRIYVVEGMQVQFIAEAAGAELQHQLGVGF